MKLEQAKNLLPLLQAYAEGKTIEFKFSGSGWKAMGSNETLNDEWIYEGRYRIAKEKKLRAWRPEEVPLGGWIKDKEAQFYYLILAVNNKGVRVMDVGAPHTYPLEYLLSDNFKVSTDCGKTWLPCGVEE